MSPYFPAYFRRNPSPLLPCSCSIAHSPILLFNPSNIQPGNPYSELLLRHFYYVVTALYRTHPEAVFIFPVEESVFRMNLRTP